MDLVRSRVPQIDGEVEHTVRKRAGAKNGHESERSGEAADSHNHARNQARGALVRRTKSGMKCFPK